MAIEERQRIALRLDLGDQLSGHSRADLVEHLAMLALLAIWAVPFTKAVGGRGVHHELIFSAALLLVLPAMQAWRAPTRSVAFAAITAIAALLVCAFAPSGWDGTDVAVSYAIAGACFVAGRRYIRDSDRRDLVAVAICLAGLYEFERAFIAWWGSRNPTTEMSGTFYWHNPYAAFLLPGAVIGLGLVATRRSPWNLAGWFSVPLCTAGIIFSSSRATMASLFVAWLLVFAVALRTRAAVVRAGGVLAVTAGVVFALPGPPFFSHYSAPWDATTVRAAGQSLAQNGGYRTEFWRSAIDVALHHPLVGSGYHALATASALYTPSNWARSTLAHDGYLQAFSDGGLLLGLPFLAAVAVLFFWALRLAWRALRRRRDGSIDPLQTVLAIALLAAFAHSAVDFDWSHPSILVEDALLAACIAPIAAHGARSPSARSRYLGYGALVALAAVLGVMIPALHQWQIDVPSTLRSNQVLLSDGGGTFGDYRPAAQILDSYMNADRPVSQQDVSRALAQTKREAGVDIHLSLLRDAAAARAGLMPDAVTQARSELALVHGATTPYIPDFALVLFGAGDEQAAVEALAADISDQVQQGGAAPDLPLELAMWARQVGTGAQYACEYDATKSLVKAIGAIGISKPTAACPAADQGLG